jgi:dTDP-4-amino-4,6-dideoxygalactose transaminase
VTFIPFNRAGLAGHEFDYMRQSIDATHISGDGSFTKKCQGLLEKELGVPKVLLTTSCTHALEMAALLLEIGPDDEVIVPSFTFVTTANAFVLRGARPVFIDVRPDTLNLDETKLEPLITPRTKAIALVHYAGVGCEMDEITAIARRHHVPIVEDNAHGLFGRYKGQYLGTFGSLATQSFHETKNFTCGEGGALLINDRSLVERAEIIREKGTNRSRFFRGQARAISRPISSPRFSTLSLRPVSRSRPGANRSGRPTRIASVTGLRTTRSDCPSYPPAASIRITSSICSCLP